jgi:hypothetical protein
MPEKLAKNSLFYLFIKLVKINSIFTAMYDYYIDANEILRITFVNYWSDFFPPCLFQVGFLVGICLPCYELMAQVLPNTKPMVEGAT